MKTIIYIVILIVISLALQMLPFLPWWSFVVPCFFAGLYMAKKEVNKVPFLTGFLAGFILWAVATLFFHAQYKGDSLQVMSGLLGFNKFIVILVIGTVGGVVAGLSTLSGALLFRKDDKDELKIRLKS